VLETEMGLQPANVRIPIIQAHARQAEPQQLITRQLQHALLHVQLGLEASRAKHREDMARLEHRRAPERLLAVRKSGAMW